MDEDRSSDDLDLQREEEKWSGRHELYFKSVIKECELHAKLNSQSAYFFYTLYVSWGLLATVVPVVCSIIVGEFGLDRCKNLGYDWVAVFCLLLTAVLNTVNGFFNFGQRYGQYQSTELMYDMLRSTISIELTKKRRFRLAPDVLLIRSVMTLEKIRQAEQIIPPHILARNKVTAESLYDDQSKPNFTAETPVERKILMIHSTQGQRARSTPVQSAP